MLKPCEPECKPKENCHSSNCKHFDLPKDPINWTPGAPYDEKTAKRHLARVQMSKSDAKQYFKEETNEHGQYSLAVIDELGNTFLQIKKWHFIVMSMA